MFGDAGEGVPGILAPANVQPRDAQRIIIEARVAHREQAAVFGIEHEQQAVEQYQGCLADFVQRGIGWRGLGDRLAKHGVELGEDQFGQAFGDPFLIEGRFAASGIVEAGCAGRRTFERGA